MATYRDPVTGRFSKAPTVFEPGIKGAMRNTATGRFASRAVFIPNRPVIYGLLPASPLVGLQMQYLLEEAADAARQIAPVRTGDYKDSIHVVEAQDGADAPGTWLLVADVDYAVYVEFGTSDTPEFAPLRRGLEAAGFDMDDVARY